MVNDPKAIENAQAIFGDKIFYSLHMKEIITYSDCVILLTSWKEYKKLKTKNFLKMKNPFVIDTRRILNLDDSKIKLIKLGVGT